MKRSPLPLLVLVTMLVAGRAAAGPFDNLDASETFLDASEKRERAARLDSLAAEVHLGLVELKRHYIRGAATPLPPVIGFELLRLRSLHTGRAELEQEALGLSASWLSLHLPNYLKHGLPVDPENPNGPSRKEAVSQAGLLEIAVMSFQASQKEMFQKAAERLADDLIRWAIMEDGVVRSGMQVDPDSIAGDPAGPDARARVTSALALAGATFQRADWIEKAVIAGRAGASATPEPATTFELAAGVLARLDAAMALGDFPGLKEASQVLLRASDADPGDWTGAAWAALALARYGTWAHDNDALEAAERCADRFGEIPAPAERNIDRFRAEAAAAYALQFLASPSPMAYIVTDPDDERGRDLRHAALSSGRPGRLIACHARNETDLLYPAAEEGPIAYVCSGELCAPPTSAPADVRTLLQTFSLPEAIPRGDTSPGDRK